MTAFSHDTPSSRPSGLDASAGGQARAADPTATDAVLLEQLQRLRADFDANFTRRLETALTGLTRCLRVMVDTETLAIPIHRVRRLVRGLDVVPVPGGPAHLLGLCNLRGELLTVYDLPALLGYPPSAPPVREMVVLAGTTFDAGVVVSGTGGLVDLDERELRSPPSTLSPAVRTLVRGTLIQGGSLFLFPDLEALFLQLDVRA
ncbi:MAG: chemotaxis protein CheW [Nitrospirota bacterium]|nr:chemotaxis protein CheW [Nitrospirota bacterium]